jgi:hypothetical protein
VGRDVAAVPQALAGQDVTPPQHVGMEQPAGVDQAAGGQDQLANPEDVSLRLEGVAEATQALAAAQIATTPLTGSQDDSDIEPEPGHEPEQELGEGEGHAEQQGEGQAGAAGEAGPSTSAGAGAEGEEAKPQAKNVVRASQVSHQLYICTPRWRLSLNLQAPFSGSSVPNSVRREASTWGATGATKPWSLLCCIRGGSVARGTKSKTKPCTACVLSCRVGASPEGCPTSRMSWLWQGSVSSLVLW